jgi:hypothetical protein
MRAYSHATSQNAKRFLHYLIKQCPLPIKSIQVSGGGEFRRKLKLVASY